MENANESLQISDPFIFEVKFLSQVAKANKSRVSIRDVISLSHTQLSEEQLESHWSTIPGLAIDYELKNGLIFERQSGRVPDLQIDAGQELEKRVRAGLNARYARQFAALIKGTKTELLAISGSTSYGTASEKDDLDFFCITKPNCLWPFLARSLVMARLLHLIRKDVPRICFSYVVDRRFAEKEFTSPNDALFARDALTAIVIHGTGYYGGLLKRSRWISGYFPRLYRQRTSPEVGREALEKRKASSPASRFLNLLLMTLIGNYIAAKSYILNRGFTKRGQLASLFKVKIGPDHCVFESAHYTRLRTMYRQLDCRLDNASQQSSVSLRGD